MVEIIVGPVSPLEAPLVANGQGIAASETQANVIGTAGETTFYGDGSNLTGISGSDAVATDSTAGDVIVPASGGLTIDGSGNVGVNVDGATIINSAGTLATAFAATGIDGTTITLNGSNQLQANYPGPDGYTIDLNGSSPAALEVKLATVSGLATMGAGLYANVDGSTITINGSNQLVASGGSLTAGQYNFGDVGAGSGGTTLLGTLPPGSGTYVVSLGYGQIVADNNGYPLSLCSDSSGNVYAISENSFGSGVNILVNWIKVA